MLSDNCFLQGSLNLPWRSDVGHRQRHDTELKRALVWSRMATLTLLLTLVHGDPDERFFHRRMTMGTKGANSFAPWQGRIPQEGCWSKLCEIVKFLSWNALILIPCRSPRTKQGVLFPEHGLPEGTSEERRHLLMGPQLCEGHRALPASPPLPGTAWK